MIESTELERLLDRIEDAGIERQHIRLKGLHNGWSATLDKDRRVRPQPTPEAALLALLEWLQRSCTGKRRFRTLEYAEVIQSHNVRNSGEPQRIYACDSCHGYHLTSNT